MAEEAARTACHVGDLGGVPERDVPVKARGVIEHCGNATKGTKSSMVHSTAVAEKRCDHVRAAIVAWHCDIGGGTHCDPC